MNKAKSFLGCYLAVLVTYLVCDGIWLGLVSQEAYQQSIGHLMRPDEFPKWPWITFYVLYAACIVRLAVLYQTDYQTKPKLTRVLSNAALLGLGSYGAYNLTNYAILDTWPIGITIKDWVWGVCVTSISAISGYGFVRYFTRFK